jgi:hypothetical protein
LFSNSSRWSSAHASTRRSCLFGSDPAIISISSTAKTPV